MGKINTYRKPKIYDTIHLPIKRILSCGVFLEEKHMKVLVSTMNNTSDNISMKENDIVEVILTDIRYEKDSFQCLAKLKELL